MKYTQFTMSLASMSAPFFISRSTTSGCPSCEATCSGVRSTFVLASLLMPALRRTSAVPACPLRAA